MTEKKIVKFHKGHGPYNAGETAKFDAHIADALCGEGGVADEVVKPKEAKAPKAREDKAVKSPQSNKQSPRDKGERKAPEKVVSK